MDRGGSAPPPRSRSQSDVRGAGQVLNPDLAMYDNLRQRSNSKSAMHELQGRDEGYVLPASAGRPQLRGSNSSSAKSLASLDGHMRHMALSREPSDSRLHYTEASGVEHGGSNTTGAFARRKDSGSSCDNEVTSKPSPSCDRRVSFDRPKSGRSHKMRMLVCMNGHVKRNPSTKEYTYDDTDVLLCSIGAPEACTTMSMLRAIVLPDDERANTYHLQYLMPPDENHLVSVRSDKDVAMMMDEWLDLDEPYAFKLRMFVEHYPQGGSEASPSGAGTPRTPRTANSTPQPGSNGARGDLARTGSAETHPAPPMGGMHADTGAAWATKSKDSDSPKGGGMGVGGGSIAREWAREHDEAGTSGEKAASASSARRPTSEPSSRNKHKRAGSIEDIEQVVHLRPAVDFINEADIQLVKGHPVSAGGFGVVHRAMWNGVEVAVKYVSPELMQQHNPKHIEEFYREAAMLSSLHHPSVVTVYGLVVPKLTETVEDEDELDEEGDRRAAEREGSVEWKSPALVTELLPLGSLRRWLSSTSSVKQLDAYKRLTLALSAARGMAYLHSRNIVHFDLKSDNLLLDQHNGKLVCKVCDFGLSKQRSHTYVSGLGGGERGTVQWMAPEVLLDSEHVDEKADVYSFGVVMWELWTNLMPYNGMSNVTVLAQVLSGAEVRPHVPGEGGAPAIEPPSPRWAELMRWCWSQSPAGRPAFTVISAELESMKIDLKKKLMGDRAAALPKASPRRDHALERAN